MAKKDTDNFDFEVEGEGKEKGKINLNLDFIKNLTKQQKGIILAALVGIILVIAIVVICIIVGTTGDDSTGSNNGGSNGGGSNGIVNGEISNFYISGTPNKKVYYIGETADYTGLSIFVRSEFGGGKYVNYADSPDDFSITGFDSSVITESLTITVEYAGKTDTFTIKVIETPVVLPTLVSIHLNPLPQTEYKVNDVFRFNGALIVCEYSDGTTKTEKLKMSHMSGYGDAISTPGEHKIKVIYFDDNGGHAETSFTITVTE